MMGGDVAVVAGIGEQYKTCFEPLRVFFLYRIGDAVNRGANHGY